MAENSKIQWCDHTVNLWWGCAKVHTGCKNCYAEHLSDVRYKNNLWGENASRRRIKSAFSDLDKYQKQANEQNTVFKIFCGSMMDIFEDTKPLANPTADCLTTNDLRYKLFNAIANGKYDNLVFLFLTKRPENISKYALNYWIKQAPRNVWFGTSISNQETANEYIPKLLEYKSSNLFLSIEPQVGAISFRWAQWHDYKNPENGKLIAENGKTYICRSQYDGIKGINWIIQGGESGHTKRPFDISWARSMRDNCKEAGIPYFFKQIDKIQPIPDDLQIQEFPEMNLI